MKLQTDYKEYQRYFKRGEDTPCLVTKFLVDEECLECSNVILTQHSQQFHGKDEIFLLEYAGQIEKVYDILELLHGYDVEVDIDNVEAIAKFGNNYKCTDMVDLAETWLEDEFSKSTEHQTIARLAEIVLSVFNMGYTQIVSNCKIKEGFSSNADIILKDKVKLGVEDNIFLFHIIFSPEKIKQYEVPALSDGIDTEYKHKTVLNLIDAFIDTDPYWIDNMKQQIDLVFEKGVDLISNIDLFKLHSKVEKRFEQLKRDVLSGAVQKIKTSEILESEAWKEYDDWKDILHLKDRADITEVVYFNIVQYILTNKDFDESSKNILRSSIDKNLCDYWNEVLDGYYLLSDPETKKNPTSGPNLAQRKYKYVCKSLRHLISRNIEGLVEYYLVTHNDLETILRSDRNRLVLNIKNVNNKPQITYTHDINGLTNATITNYMFALTEVRQDAQNRVVITDYKSPVSSSYEDFVNFILKNIKTVWLIIVTLNNEYDGNKSNGANKKRKLEKDLLCEIK